MSGGWTCDCSDPSKNKKKAYVRKCRLCGMTRHQARKRDLQLAIAKTQFKGAQIRKRRQSKPARIIKWFADWLRRSQP